jgi:hypothetical protein
MKDSSLCCENSSQIIEVADDAETAIFALEFQKLKKILEEGTPQLLTAIRGVLMSEICIRGQSATARNICCLIRGLYSHP